MLEPYGRRVVTEPQRRPQGYVVGDQTVSRSELQAVLMLFKYVLTRWLPPTDRYVRMLEEVDRVNMAALYANNDLNWDCLEGVGESYIAESDVPDNSIHDKFLYPNRWWKVLPPCPLPTI